MLLQKPEYVAFTEPVNPPTTAGVTRERIRWVWALVYFSPHGVTADHSFRLLGNRWLGT